MFQLPVYAVVAAPLSYVGLVAALVIIVGVAAYVWVMVRRVVQHPNHRLAAEQPRQLVDDESPDLDQASGKLGERETMERRIKHEHELKDPSTSPRT